MKAKSILYRQLKGFDLNKTILLKEKITVKNHIEYSKEDEYYFVEIDRFIRTKAFTAFEGKIIGFQSTDKENEIEIRGKIERNYYDEPFTCYIKNMDDDSIKRLLEMI